MPTMTPDPVPRTVQEYIDETPVWRDGTDVADAPMTAMQWQIWALATAGKFFEGLVVFMTGVALPLLSIEFHLDATQKGMVGSATLFGILIGATALGGLADRFGRKQIFIAEMVLFLVFLVGVTLSPSFPLLLAALFGMGLALGCDYPTAHLVISESIPSRCRGRLVLSAFGFQAVGALAGTIVGFVILRGNENIADWRAMYATAIIPTVLVVFGRFFITQSPHWLMARGRIAEAEHATLRLLRRSPSYPRAIKLKPAGAGHAHHGGGFFEIFSKRNRRATFLASVPWFLQDLGTYGIGIFTPTILVTILGHPHTDAPNLAAVIHNDMMAAKGAAFLDALLIVGIVLAVLLADSVGRIRLQVIGFIGCAAGLLLSALATSLHHGTAQITLIFAGFMLFNLMTNAGPNAMTYLIAGEVFPTGIRGAGAGFAASFAKIGAVVTAFLFPILLARIGTATLLYTLVATSILGAIITWRYRIETKGLNLETLGTTTDL